MPSLLGNSAECSSGFIWRGLCCGQNLLCCSGVSIHPVFTFPGRPAYSTNRLHILGDCFSGCHPGLGQFHNLFLCSGDLIVKQKVCIHIGSSQNAETLPDKLAPFPSYSTLSLEFYYYAYFYPVTILPYGHVSITAASVNGLKPCWAVYKTCLLGDCIGNPLQLEPSGTGCPWALITLGRSDFLIYSPWRPASSPGLPGCLGTRLQPSWEAWGQG